MSEKFVFQKAERTQLKLKIGLTGPAGSGKSFTALRLARGIVGPKGKIALINTEKNRGEIYSTEFDYDMINLDPPFSPERFNSAMDAAIDAGFDLIILDSSSHEWMGEGGILDMANKMDGNSFVKWAKLTPRHDAFIEKITTSDIHIIVCMRGKDEYILEENDKGKQVPKKIGLGSQQRTGFEYEFHVAFNINMQHISEPVKDNSHLFDGQYKILSEKDGEDLIAWATSGKEVKVVRVSALEKVLKAIDEAGTKEDLEKVVTDPKNASALNKEEKVKAREAFDKKLKELEEKNKETK